FRWSLLTSAATKLSDDFKRTICQNSASEIVGMTRCAAGYGNRPENTSCVSCQTVHDGEHGKILVSQNVFAPAKNRSGIDSPQRRLRGCGCAIQHGVEVRQWQRSDAGLRAGGGMVSQGGGPM